MLLGTLPTYCVRCMHLECHLHPYSEIHVCQCPMVLGLGSSAGNARGRARQSDLIGRATGDAAGAHLPPACKTDPPLVRCVNVGYSWQPSTVFAKTCSRRRRWSCWGRRLTRCSCWKRRERRCWSARAAAMQPSRAHTLRQHQGCRLCSAATRRRRSLLGWRRGSATASALLAIQAHMLLSVIAPSVRCNFIAIRMRQM